jgi:hypothetical protein
MSFKRLEGGILFLLYALHSVFLKAKPKLKNLLYKCFTCFTLLYGALHCFTYGALHCFTLFFISILAIKKYIYVMQKNVWHTPTFPEITIYLPIIEGVLK